ncbi:MFS transporter [Brevibacillus humidisoli]|uniref:MFS transporter n=1 Tax=Brevibacillus humidisoli TaxID=2895522 RepID=UPI001E379E41|nr:MFS transporter [Brevibacillus humidisoli]UFJ39745.1 MFS transporter [Brevibacillus humidisoli]
MPSSRFTIWTLIVVVAVAGANQGLTLPLLAILLEEQGVSSVANGLNAAAMYIGILLVAPWWEAPLRRWGYRSLIVFGLVLVTVSTLLLPFFDGLIIWFLLRLVMGIGDSGLHYASQLWITEVSPPERRGRDISLYGLAYGVGFSIGPLGINLLGIGRWAPFFAVSLLYLVAFVMIARLPNAHPQPIAMTGEKRQNRYVVVTRLAWLALLPPFLYGYMEASLNGNFPVYALRTGVSAEWVSIILPSFVVGSLFLQLPLGTLSDRVGRRQVMMGCGIVGAISFSLFPLVGDSTWLMMVLLAAAGAAVGSFYSLGMAYAADLLPLGMVPTAGIIAGINFSVASIIGPNVNGYLIEYLSPGLMFWVMAAMLAAFAASCLLFRSPRAAQQVDGMAAAEEDGHSITADGKC